MMHQRTATVRHCGLNDAPTNSHRAPLWALSRPNSSCLPPTHNLLTYAHSPTQPPTPTPNAVSSAPTTAIRHVDSRDHHRVFCDGELRRWHRSHVPSWQLHSRRQGRRHSDCSRVKLRRHSVNLPPDRHHPPHELFLHSCQSCARDR
jgi:hypothetical protein